MPHLGPNLTGNVRCPPDTPSQGRKIPRIVGTSWHLFVKEITPGRRCRSDCQAAFARRYAPKTGIPCAYRNRYCLPARSGAGRANRRRHDVDATRSARSDLGGGWFRSRRGSIRLVRGNDLVSLRTNPTGHWRRDGPATRPLHARYDVAERHHVRVMAPPEITLSAAADTDLQRSAVIRAIFRTRELVLGAEPDAVTRPKGLLAQTASLGWGVLAEKPGREIVVGAVTQPWMANVVFRALPPDEFRAFAEPGYVKIIWTLRADPVGSEESMFRTETRVATTRSYGAEEVPLVLGSLLARHRPDSSCDARI